MSIFPGGGSPSPPPPRPAPPPPPPPPPPKPAPEPEGKMVEKAQVKAKVEAMGQQMDVETTFVDYHDIDGMKIPKKIEASMPMGTMTTTMDEVKLNEKIDDSVFAKPAN